ncbi:hypothetical protein [Flavobacterium sp.]|uniref:hypothetical protein n=1 Tax=Flavobacterium sp. TaxID=239 RepID=UPI003753759B
MNIIELFENAGIYKENATRFTFDDTVKIQKQIEIERSQNPNIDGATATNLTLAMNDYPKELLFISGNRILYNFFAKKNHSRTRFMSDIKNEASPEAVKLFIDKFLSDDLNAFFDKKITENRFDDIEDLLVVKEYLPQNALDKLNKKVSEKLDLVVEKLEKNPTIEDSISFNFIKHRSFYDLLSHFRSLENDEKIKKLMNLMSSTLVNFDIKISFLNPMMLAMSNYKAVDNDLANLLKSNKDDTIVRTQKTSGNSSSALSTGSMIVLAIVVIRLILLMVRCSR